MGKSGKYCTTTQLPSGCRQGTSYGVCGLGTLGGWGEDFLKDTATFPETLLLIRRRIVVDLPEIVLTTITAEKAYVSEYKAGVKV